MTFLYLPSSLFPSLSNKSSAWVSKAESRYNPEYLIPFLSYISIPGKFDSGLTL